MVPKRRITPQGLIWPGDKQLKPTGQQDACTLILPFVGKLEGASPGHGPGRINGIAVGPRPDLRISRRKSGGCRSRDLEAPAGLADSRGRRGPGVPSGQRGQALAGWQTAGQASCRLNQSVLRLELQREYGPSQVLFSSWIPVLRCACDGQADAQDQEVSAQCGAKFVLSGSKVPNRQVRASLEACCRTSQRQTKNT